VFPTLVSARLRPLAIAAAAAGLVAAVVLAGVSLAPAGATIPGAPVQAHAAGGSCGNWFDDPGTIYGPRDYAPATWSVYDNSVGHNVDIHADLEDFQYTDPNTGHCFAGYRGSAWGPYSDSTGYHAYLRKWICGHQEPSDENATTAGTGSARVSYAWDGYRGTILQMWVGAVSATITFYDVSGCGFQADNYWTSASSNFWSAAPSSYTGSQWYLHIG
jgi:hypothetical protein